MQIFIFGGKQDNFLRKYEKNYWSAKPMPLMVRSTGSLSRLSHGQDRRKPSTCARLTDFIWKPLVTGTPPVICRTGAKRQQTQQMYLQWGLGNSMG